MKMNEHQCRLWENIINLIEYEIRKNNKFEIMNERIYPIDVNPE